MISPTSASPDLFDRLLDQYTQSRERERRLREEGETLKRLLLRVLQDDQEMGSLAPHTVEYARRVLGLPAAGKYGEGRP